MKPLQERNQATVGLVTLVVLVLLVVGAFHAEDIPGLGGGTGYSARFTESAGLKEGDEVRVAGIKVGEVTHVGLERGQVAVDFRVKNVRVGNQSRVAIEIKTLLGEKFLAVRPGGVIQQDPDVPIPVERTSTPFEVPEAFNQLAHTVDQIDTARLAQSFRALSDTFANTPAHFGKTLTGLSRLSETITSRDKEVTALLAGTAKVSGVVAQRNEQVARLVRDGNKLLDELSRRKEAITDLLDNTRRLADQLRGLVKDNRGRIHPALEQLDRTTEMLARNKAALEHGIASLANYTRVFIGAVSAGRWFDGYFCGMLNPTFVAGGLQFNPGTCGPPKGLSSGKPGPDSPLFPLLGGDR